MGKMAAEAEKKCWGRALQRSTMKLIRNHTDIKKSIPLQFIYVVGICLDMVGNIWTVRFVSIEVFGYVPGVYYLLLFNIFPFEIVFYSVFSSILIPFDI